MRSALAKVPEIENLKTTPNKDGGSATFTVPDGFDYAAKLDAIAADGNEHVAGWKPKG